MKWAFLIALVLAVPMIVALLNRNPRNLVHASFFLGASILLLGPTLWAAPIPWPGWPGPVQGLELSFVDSLSIALILSTRPVAIPWWIKLAFALFCSSLVISTSLASQRMPSVFYAWQLLRSVLLFIAVARTCGAAKNAPVALMAGLGLGLIYEGVFTVYQYHSGVERPGGNMGHSNFLGLVSDFVTFPVLALALGTRRLVWPAIVLLAGFAIALLGGSRATLGLFAIGVLLTLIFSLKRRSTPRKITFGAVTIFLLLISSTAMIPALHQRSLQSLQSSDAEREAMKDAARLIIGDHPFGVGANQYVIVANTGGYSQRAGVPWNVEDRSAPVHDTYYLIAAELGFIGLIGFLMTLGSFVGLALINLKGKSDEAGEMVPGLLSAIIIATIHISYEWVFMTFLLHYMFAIAAGLLVGIASRMRKPARLQHVRAVARMPSRVSEAG